jgi:hypothetical protein
MVRGPVAGLRGSSSSGIHGIHPDHADGDQDAGIDPAQHVRGDVELLAEFGPGGFVLGDGGVDLGTMGFAFARL